MPEAAPLIPIIMQIAGMGIQQDAARSATHNIQDIPLSSGTGQPFSTAPWGTGQSSTGPLFTQIDPTLTGLRQSLLSQYQSMMPQAQGMYGSLLNQNQNLLTQAGANSPAFIQSQVDPLKQNIASAWGDLVLGQQRGGIRGSSLGNTAVTNFADITGRSMADATAQAQQQSIGLQGNLLGQQQGMTSGLLGAEGNILGGQETINQNQLGQILASLGLDQNSIRLMLARQEMLNQTKGGGQAGLGAGLMGLGGMLGGLMGGGGGGGAAASGPSGFGFDLGSGLSTAW
jgi:hypothetical protein